LDKRWYETFFRGIALEMWRRAAAMQPTAAEADFVGRELLLKPGARVLDVPCGMGRHAIELARRGYRVTGVDLSAEAIEDARRNGAAAGAEVAWRQADMRDLPWQAEMDGACCLGNSFGYLEPEATREFLRAVARALRPGARFALDYGLAAECILPRLREREWCQVGDIFFLEENRYLAAESCVETIYTFMQGGTIESRTGLQWVWTVRELAAMLEDAGLAVKGLYRSPAGEPFEVGSQILLLVAEKAG
jgi:SAM-dependent methyltransferase